MNRIYKSNVEFNNELLCVICGKNIISDIKGSMFQIPVDSNTGEIVAFNPCCKGKCDHAISRKYQNCNNGWREVYEFLNPYVYLDLVIRTTNRLSEGKGFASKEALNQYKNALITLYPYISREVEEDEEQYAEMVLSSIF